MPSMPPGRNRSNTTSELLTITMPSDSRMMRMWLFCSGGPTTQSSIRTCQNRQTLAAGATSPMTAQWRKRLMAYWLIIRVSSHRNRASNDSRNWGATSTGTRRRRLRTQIDPRISTGFFGRARLLQKVRLNSFGRHLIDRHAVSLDFDWHF